jgi:prepilin-type N-terminal cleavage/methylation domain-containing protein
MRPNRERGFTLIEVLIALMVSIIGLSGVLIIQANTVKANRETALMNTATTIAEQYEELARGYTVAQLAAGIAPITYTDPRSNVTYTITITWAPIAGQDNLAMMTTTVTFVPNRETGTAVAAATRTARVQMIRTLTEAL